jgi:hypothetical protein
MTAVSGKEVELTLDELATELSVRPRHLTHVLNRGMLSAVRVDGDKYFIDAIALAEQKERNRIGREELAYAFANQDEIRRKFVLESAGVDEETATRLGY